MNCSELITTFLADYIEGQLPPDTLADFEHHLDVCPSCVAYLQSYRATMALAAGATVVPDDVPEELVNAILETVSR
jgi:anti-sigma factor RsiW